MADEVRAGPASSNSATLLVIVLKLIPHSHHVDSFRVFNRAQSHAVCFTKGNDQLAQKPAFSGLAIDKGSATQTNFNFAGDRVKSPLGRIQFFGGPDSVPQEVSWSQQIVSGRLGVAEIEGARSTPYLLAPGAELLLKFCMYLSGRVVDPGALRIVAGRQASRHEFILPALDRVAHGGSARFQPPRAVRLGFVVS